MSIHAPARPASKTALSFEWRSTDGSARFIEAVVALLGPVAERIELSSARGWRPVGDLSALALVLHRGADVRLRLGTGVQVELSLTGPVALRVTPGSVSWVPAARTWLQAEPLLRSPVVVLAVPLPACSVHPDFLHGLVALAHRCAPLAGVTCLPGDGQPALRWTSEPGSGLPLVSRSSDAVWLVGTQGEAGPLRFLGEPEPEPCAALVGELQALLARAPNDLETLAARLRAELPFGPALRLVLPTPEPAAFHVPAPATACLRMVPEAEHVRIELDPAFAATDAAFALAHAAAHLRLGHLRPGDPFGHWDTRESITSATPSRRWDRETRALLPVWASPAASKRASLDECTPREKAWLVLLDHIGRMVGETHTLDPAAERYQPAAYQRQAAQRLVTQLDEHGGAMLCDGVGLGKTYVATTVLVHYANTWQQRLAAAGRSTAEDPLRVTILAPNSVVSTWQREALPALAAHGVQLATVRVISHTKLSRILRTSEILERKGQQPSDMEHLLLSDLVIVDEAHNFRSIAARRTVVLRDLLRLQPRGDQRRKVLLLTATPVNNSLEDLRQQAALLFCKPLRFTDNLAPNKYREEVFTIIKARLAAAHAAKTGDVAALLIHGNPEAKFSFALDFRDDLKFGVQVPRVGDYLREQEKRLGVQQAATRAAMQAKQPLPPQTGRIAGDLLDRIVVQRSRALCKQIEGEQGSEVRLLFRPDAPAPEKLVYEDVYDDTRDVLARFLPLFETGEDAGGGPLPPLSLKVYMWADVRDKEREADELSSVVGLQRVLVLKRLESSPVAFLITLLRLLALHAHRLRQLSDLCHVLGDRLRGRELDAELEARLAGLQRRDQEHLHLLLTGTTAELRGRPLLTSWSEAHKGARAAAGDDEPPSQLDFYAASDDSTATQREQLDRLWGLKDDLLRDFGTLLDTAPGLADLIFGRFDDADWPRNFIVGGERVLWPRSATWGLRIVTDAKLCRLVARLLSARADGQKVIVFSQFTDTLAYLSSVLQATAGFERKDWTLALRSLTEQTDHPVKPEDMRALVASCALVSGETEDRDAIIHSFAPFYRLGPRCPTLEGAAPNDRGELAALAAAWREDWTRALQQPVDVLLATDVLAEGVNLQDAAQLINYDVHWNPVRMIQRSGRIDRRLKPDIEDATTFPDLEALAAELRVPAPRYWWHDHPGAATTTVNLLLPDELEEELQLRERIANKTLAIDFTLGLEQGTGAEAEWMTEYRYHGISALNAWQGDRAIERVAGYQERLRRMLAERTIDPAWIAKWNGWIREEGADVEAPLLAWARLGLKGEPLTREYSRVLRPKRQDGVLVCSEHQVWLAARERLARRGRRDIISPDGHRQIAEELRRDVEQYFAAEGAARAHEPRTQAAAWTAELVCLEAASGGLHLEIGPLRGLWPFVKRLALAGDGSETVLLASNLRERVRRVQVLPDSGPWRWLALGFEDDPDVDLSSLTVDGLERRRVYVFRVDAEGVGRLLRGNELSPGQHYRILIPPTRARDALREQLPEPCGAGWLLWELALPRAVPGSTFALLRQLGFELGTAMPGIRWVVIPPLEWRHHRGEAHPCFWPTPGPVIALDGLQVEVDDEAAVFVHGPGGTETQRLPVGDTQLLQFRHLQPGPHVLLVTHCRTAIPRLRVPFEIVEHLPPAPPVGARLLLGEEVLVARPGAMVKAEARDLTVLDTGSSLLELRLELPPGWPVQVLWRELAEKPVRGPGILADGRLDPRTLSAVVERARRTVTGDLVFDLGELGRICVEHARQRNVGDVRESLRRLLELRSPDAQRGAYASLITTWFKPVCDALGYKVEPIPFETLPEAPAHLAALRLVHVERQGSQQSWRVARALILCEDLKRDATAGVLAWIDAVCSAEGVREALVTDGHSWAPHRRGSRLPLRGWEMSAAVADDDAFLSFLHIASEGL